MKKMMRNVCVLVFYGALLLACVAGMGMLGTIFPVPNRFMVGVGVWFLFCLGGLCVPDEVWNRWLPKK